jgi:Spy/CpxP family protein refolding chaperone
MQRLLYILFTVIMLAPGLALAEKSAWFDSEKSKEENGFGEYGLDSNDVSYRLVTMQRHLNLTDEQFSKLRVIFTEYDNEFAALQSEKQQYERILSRILEKGRLDQDLLNNTAAKLGDVTARIAVLRITNRAEMYNALNPEQQKKFQQYWRFGLGRDDAEKGQGANW